MEAEVRQYRECGIRTVPFLIKKVDGKWDKIPLAEWKNRTLDDAIECHPDQNGVGIICGDVITVVDIDDSSYYSQALDRFGETPLQSETPSEGFHLWYRADGERTRTKVDGLPIDIRGKGGLAVVPPSEGYDFTIGSINQIPELPTIQRGALGRSSKEPPKGSVPVGRRNDWLFREGVKLASSVESGEALLERLEKLNASETEEPLPAREVEAVAESVWGYRMEGRLFQSTDAAAVIHPHHLELSADALKLWIDLRHTHGWREGGDFVLANATRERFGWTIPRLRKAIQELEQSGYLELTVRGQKGVPHPRRARLLA